MLLATSNIGLLKRLFFGWSSPGEPSFLAFQTYFCHYSSAESQRCGTIGPTIFCHLYKSTPGVRGQSSSILLSAGHTVFHEIPQPEKSLQPTLELRSETTVAHQHLPVSTFYYRPLHVVVINRQNVRSSTLFPRQNRTGFVLKLSKSIKIPLPAMQNRREFT